MTDLFLRLFNMSISASWIVLAVIILRLLLKKAPRWVNVALLGFVGIRLVLPFSFKSILSVIPSSNTIPTEITETASPYIESGFTAVNQAVNPVISTALAPNTVESISPMEFIISAAAIIWLVGVGLMLLYTFVSYLTVYRFVKGSSCEKENIFRSARIDSPFIMGIIRPKIYLPEFLNSEEADYVIAHEKAHIKRLDYLWKPLAFALLSVYWYNPLMWVGYIFLCRDIEYACDEKVIKQYGEEHKVPYSKVLIECSIPRKAVTACPVAFGEVGIKSRIKNILSYKKPSFWIIAVSLVLCVAVAVCFLTDPLNNGNGADFITKKDKTVQNLEDEVVTSSVTTTKDGNTASNTDGSVNKVTSTVITEENKDFLNERDNFGDLDLDTVKKIKRDYVKTHDDLNINDIFIEKYYGTFSDGSIAVSISQFGLIQISTTQIDTNVIFVAEYVYHPYALNILIYKNSEFNYIHDAYNKKLISKKVLDEIFEIPNLDFKDKYFTNLDNVDDISKKTVIRLKRHYMVYLQQLLSSKHGVIGLENCYIDGYYTFFKNDYKGFILKHTVDNDDVVTEKIGDYNYTHKKGEGLFLFNEKSASSSSVKVISLVDAYRLNLITDSELSEFFNDFPEYNKK